MSGLSERLIPDDIYIGQSWITGELAHLISKDCLTLGTAQAEEIKDDPFKFLNAVSFWPGKIRVEEGLWEILLEGEVPSKLRQLVLAMAQNQNLPWSHQVVQRVWEEFNKDSEALMNLRAWIEMLSFDKVDFEARFIFLKINGSRAGAGWSSIRANVITAMTALEREAAWKFLTDDDKAGLADGFIYNRVTKIGDYENIPVSWCFNKGARSPEFELRFIQSLSPEQFEEVAPQISEYMPMGVLEMFKGVEPERAQKWPKEVKAAWLKSPDKRVRIKALQLLGEAPQRLKLG